MDPSVPFTTAEALAAGLTRHVLAGPRFQQVFRGIHLAADVEVTAQVRARAATRLHPASARISHLSAAHLLGVPVPHSALVHLTVPRHADRRRHPGLVHHVRAGSGDFTWPGLFGELGECLGLVDLVVAGDWMVRQAFTTAEALVASPGPPGTARAARLVRDRVDSPMETRLRLLLVLAGLPEPVVNATVAGSRYRADLSYPGLHLLIEYDGRQHRDDEAQWRHDLTRREWLDRHGQRLVVVTSEGLFARPDTTLERVATAIREQGGRVPQWRQEWRAHFAVRPA